MSRRLFWWTPWLARRIIFPADTLLRQPRHVPVRHTDLLAASCAGQERDPMFKCGFQFIIRWNLTRCNDTRGNFMRKVSSKKIDPITSTQLAHMLDMQMRKSDVERRSPATSLNQAQHFVPHLAQFPQAGGRPPRGEKKFSAERVDASTG